MSGAKWKPIHMTTGCNRKWEPSDTSERTYAIHLECSEERLRTVCKKLKKFYGSKPMKFSDGTKKRIIPPFSLFSPWETGVNSPPVLLDNRLCHPSWGPAPPGKCQSTNLLLDKPHSVKGISYHQLMIEIWSEAHPHTSLFHSIDRQWRLENP
jgi:hypothetical protein